jgi:large subunit ribosomal protein L12
MEYIYAALILHESGKEIDEKSLTKVLKAADVKVEDVRVKALVAALEDVDIEEALETGQIVIPAVGGGSAAIGGEEAATADSGNAEEAKASAEEETKKAEEEEAASAAGLGDLFG